MVPPSAKETNSSRRIFCIECRCIPHLHLSDNKQVESKFDHLKLAYVYNQFSASRLQVRYHLKFYILNTYFVVNGKFLKSECNYYNIKS